MTLPILPHHNTLTWHTYLILHNTMQNNPVTTSTGHLATNFFAETFELSLKLLTRSHMPQFLPHNHTTEKK